MIHSERVKFIQKDIFGKKYVGTDLRTLDNIPEFFEPLSRWLKNPKGFLILAGSNGCGKTTIGAGLVPVIAEDRKFQSYRFIREDQYFSKLKSYFGMQGNIEDAVTMLCDDDFYYFDDLGANPPKADDEGNWRREMILKFIELRYCLEKYTVISTNLTKENIQTYYQNRVYSRMMEDCLWIDGFHLPDLRQGDDR